MGQGLARKWYGYVCKVEERLGDGDCVGGVVCGWGGGAGVDVEAGEGWEEEGGEEEFGG